MANQIFGQVILWLIILAIVVVIAVYLLRWLYRRSTKETPSCGPASAARRS